MASKKTNLRKKASKVSGGSETERGETSADYSDGASSLRVGTSITPVGKKRELVSGLMGGIDTGRAQRIDELKEKISSGDYEVDTREVAQSIVEYFESN